MHIEDHLADPHDYPLQSVFDPDNILTEALLSQLATATSTSSQLLCQPFIRSGTVVTNTNPILFSRGLKAVTSSPVNCMKDYHRL